MDTDVIEKIKSLFPDNSVMEKESMKRHTTFRAGGEAALFVEIENTKQLRALLRILVKNAIPYFIKGNGSNLLVSDSGYQGVIIELGSQYSKVTIDGREIHAMAGTLLSKVAKCACEAGLSGMEFASGIPGTVGGAMVMNAGAYDGDLFLHNEPPLDNSERPRRSHRPTGKAPSRRNSQIKRRGKWIWC